VDGVHDVTDTSGAAESLPVVRGHVVAYAATTDGWYTAVHVMDLAGHRAAASPPIERLQVAITNLQQTGLASGVARHSFRLITPARHASVAWVEDGTLEIRADDRRGHGAHTIVVDPGDARVLRGGDFVRAVPDEIARPGSLLTWAVDRLRAEPWFGDRRMQWVKVATFAAADRWRSLFARRATAPAIAEDPTERLPRSSSRSSARTLVATT
jgi:hypothetical protein